MATIPPRGPTMNAVPTIGAVLLLLAVLAFAVLRPRGLPEAVAAVPAAGLVLLLGWTSGAQALDTLDRLAPTLIFLAAILVIAHLADREGVFRWLGSVLASRSRGEPRRMLLLTFLVASVTTAVLSLDATVLLLTPTVIVALRGSGVRRGPALYATAHLSNTASLLLPVSNLTNLLAFQAAGLGFLHFTALMAGPWVAAIAVEYLLFRLFFAKDLRKGPAPTDQEPTPVLPPPRTALVLLALVLAGFALGQTVGIDPMWIALVGALGWSVRGLVSDRTTLRRLAGELHLPFLAFVAALGIVVDAATGHGLSEVIGRLLPTGTGWLDLVVVTLIAALLSNVVNNLPATLVLLAVLSPTVAPVTVLAILIGVNLGPNLTYTGSLATLLWRRVLQRQQASPSLGVFTRLGLLTVPATLLAATTVLWLASSVL